MNIFLLDKPCDISTIAQSHCDKHVSKMILESAQMLCTASWLSGITASYQNWLWLQELTLKLNEEFCWRYGRSANHKSADVVKGMTVPDTLPSTSSLAHPQCIPDQYRVIDNPVSAYRNYYLNEKRFAVWTKREEPVWWN